MEDNSKIKYKKEQLEIENSILDRLYVDLKNVYVDGIFERLVNLILIFGELFLFYKGYSLIKLSGLISYMITLFIAIRVPTFLVCGNKKSRLLKIDELNNNIEETLNNIENYKREIVELLELEEAKTKDNNLDDIYNNYVETFNNSEELDKENEGPKLIRKKD